jgi:hypothetical protein
MNRSVASSTGKYMNVLVGHRPLRVESVLAPGSVVSLDAWTDCVTWFDEDEEYTIICDVTPCSPAEIH